MLDDVTLRLIAGALAGAAVGLERQWSAQAPGRAARFGGLRTFTFIGLVGANAGWLWTLERCSDPRACEDELASAPTRPCR